MEVKRLFLRPLIFLSLFTAWDAGAQNFALKNNLFYDATATANLGAEVGLAPHWTFDLSGNLNAWSTTSQGRVWKHWLVQPELRYWFCERFGGHFLGAHLLGGQYNLGRLSNGITSWPIGLDISRLSDNRFQGWGIGAGIAYGYAFMLGEHWNLELELGLGYIYSRYDVYQCTDCGKKVESDQPANYVGPTKAAVNIVYVF